MPIYNSVINDQHGNPSPEGLMRVGAFFPIEVEVPPQIAAALSGQSLPVPAGQAGLAIIDTGATMTCVDEPILTKLGLNPVGVVNSGTANGPVQQSVYPCRLVFPTTGWTIDLAAVAGVDLTGQELQLDPAQPAQPIAVLLGRNLLQSWTMYWNGPGGFWTVAF